VGDDGQSIRPLVVGEGSDTEIDSSRNEGELNVIVGDRVSSDCEKGMEKGNAGGACTEGDDDC